MKVAIIGTGISGLAVAHSLKERAELTLFEADRRIGGHANTVVVESERGFETVDTGFIVFNDRNYPEFTRILEELEVPAKPSTMSFSYTDGSFEYTGRNLNGLFAKRSNVVSPRYLSMLREFTRFQRILRELAASGEQGPSLDALLDEHRFSARVASAGHRSDGRLGLVGRLRSDVQLSRRFPRAISRQSRPAFTPRAAALANRRGRLLAVRAGAYRADP